MKLWKHQQSFLVRMRVHRAWGLFWEMGTGKTYATIEGILQKQKDRGKPLKVLVLCPPVVITNWEREIYKFSAKGINPVALIGAIKDRAATVNAMATGQRTGAIITNYEALTNPKFFAAIGKWAPDVIVFDEAHKLKNATSKRSKAAFKIAKEATFRFVLTGTPILNTPMDIFGVYRVIDLGETFGDNFYSFRMKYFYDRNSGMPQQKYFPKWTMRTNMEDELKGDMAKQANFIVKTECLDLPPLVRKRLDIALSAEQLKAYTEMRDEFIAFVKEQHQLGVATAATAMTKALRLQQIISGHLPVEDDNGDRTATFKDTPRRKALAELLEEYAPRHKIIVWAAFRHDYKEIAAVCDELGIKCLELHGGTTATQRPKVVDLFNTDPEYRVLIGNGLSAGVGINLTASDMSVYFSRSFSLEADLQSEARNWRGGSEIHKVITRVDFVAPGTIDELCYEALHNKKNLSDNLLELVRYI